MCASIRPCNRIRLWWLSSCSLISYSFRFHFSDRLDCSYNPFGFLSLYFFFLWLALSTRQTLFTLPYHQLCPPSTRRPGTSNKTNLIPTKQNKIHKIWWWTISWVDDNGCHERYSQPQHERRRIGFDPIGRPSAWANCSQRFIADHHWSSYFVARDRGGGPRSGFRSLHHQRRSPHPKGRFVMSHHTLSKKKKSFPPFLLILQDKDKFDDDMATNCAWHIHQHCNVNNLETNRHQISCVFHFSRRQSQLLKPEYIRSRWDWWR